MARIRAPLFTSLSFSLSLSLGEEKKIRRFYRHLCCLPVPHIHISHLVEVIVNMDLEEVFVGSHGGGGRGCSIGSYDGGGGVRSVDRTGGIVWH